MRTIESLELVGGRFGAGTGRRLCPAGIAQIFSYVEQPDKLLSPIECDYREH